MINNSNSKVKFFSEYVNKLSFVLNTTDWNHVSKLANALFVCWQNGNHVFICGNGGSAGNAIHLANDFLYGIAKESGRGLKVSALPANPAVLTCLANDVGYDAIYSEQIAVMGIPGDILIVLSGSGNSKNILKALEQAKKQNISTYAILGYSGGKAKILADTVIHFPINDMQISEDLQLIVGHMIMQYLYAHKNELTYELT